MNWWMMLLIYICCFLASEVLPASAAATPAAAVSRPGAFLLRKLKQQAASRNEWQPVFVSRVICHEQDTVAAAAAATMLVAARDTAEPTMKLRRLSNTHKLRILVNLMSKDPRGLDAMAKAVCDQSSSHYQNFLTPTELGKAFGAPAKAISNMRKYLVKHGLTIEKVMSNQLAIAAMGTASQVSKAFNTSIAQYAVVTSADADGVSSSSSSSSSSSDRELVLHAPVVQPRLPAYLASWVESVLGLDNAPAAAPIHQKVSGAETAGADADSSAAVASSSYAADGHDALGGSDSGNRALLHTSGQNSKFLTVPRLRKVYNLPSTEFDGKRQTVAVATYNYYDSFDVEEFALANGLTPPNVEDRFTSEQFDDTDPVPTLVNLQMLVATAPSANILVYIGENTDAGEAYMFQQIADDYKGDPTGAAVVLYTWGRAEHPSDLRSPLNTIFKQMTIQGQAIVVPAGDCGSGVKNAANDGCAESGTGVGFPQNLEWVTAVGGTKATLYFEDKLAQELAWPSSGGGISSVVPQPTWQQGLASAGSRFRAVPDVSLSADAAAWPYEIWSPVDNFTTTGGTAAAASVWAGFAIMINQCRQQRGLKKLGALNPHLYRLGKAGGSTAAEAFHDVVKGSNGAFSAAAGYDPVTGWGSMNGKKLLAALCPGYMTEGACCYTTKLGALRLCRSSTSDVCSGTFHPAKSCSQVACQ